MRKSRFTEARIGQRAATKFDPGTGKGCTGAGISVTRSGQGRQTFFGRMVTITRSRVGAISGRQMRSSRIRRISPRPQPKAGSPTRSTARASADLPEDSHDLVNLCGMTGMPAAASFTDGSSSEARRIPKSHSQSQLQRVRHTRP